MKAIFLSLSLTAALYSCAQVLQADQLRTIAGIGTKDSLNIYLNSRGYRQVNPVLALQPGEQPGQNRLQAGDSWVFDNAINGSGQNLLLLVRYRDSSGRYSDTTAIQLTVETSNRFIYSALVNQLMERGFTHLQLNPGNGAAAMELSNGVEHILLETGSGVVAGSAGAPMYKLHYQHPRPGDPDPVFYRSHRSTVPRKVTRNTAQTKAYAVTGTKRAAPVYTTKTRVVGNTSSAPRRKAEKRVAKKRKHKRQARKAL